MDLKKKIEEIAEYNLERLDAANYKYTKVGQLSRGTKQKIAICRALLNNPEVMLLDEPTAFLDPKASNEVHEIINGSKATIVYATQRLEEIHKIDGKILILKKGRVEGFGKTNEILSKIKNVKVEIYLLERSAAIFFWKHLLHRILFNKYIRAYIYDHANNNCFCTCG
jgi:ABC-type multidrug transport system ATPase subunit